MSEQTTPRTVEEAARVIALLDDAIARVPKIGGAGAIYEAELLTVLRVARTALAAGVPSVEEVAEVLAEKIGWQPGIYEAAERVVALWGGGERG